ncbi:hypothetical protein RvY_08555-5, partial [Ramazzottius varieornatus]
MINSQEGSGESFHTPPRSNSLHPCPRGTVAVSFRRCRNVVLVQSPGWVRQRHRAGGSFRCRCFLRVQSGESFPDPPSVLIATTTSISPLSISTLSVSATTTSCLVVSAAITSVVLTTATSTVVSSTTASNCFLAAS